jgi:cytochrome oxidase Cu insertion factor (SCO1/SenC/PrrC family)
MTDEERDTRHGLELASALRKHDVAIVNLRDSAADEIERLAKELKKSKAKVRELEAELDDYL